MALNLAITKARRRLVPFLLLLYVLAFLDRVNVGFAKVAMMADTGLSAAAYAFGAGLFFAGYALLEVPSNLTARELEVLTLIGRGMRNAEVAAQLMLSENTVSGYIKAIYRKLGISSRAEASWHAAQLGLSYGGKEGK